MYLSRERLMYLSRERYTPFLHSQSRAQSFSGSLSAGPGDQPLTKSWRNSGLEIASLPHRLPPISSHILCPFVPRPQHSKFGPLIALRSVCRQSILQIVEIMVKQLLTALFVYSLALFYGFLVFLALLWEIIRNFGIPPRAKKRETRKCILCFVRSSQLKVCMICSCTCK